MNRSQAFNLALELHRHRTDQAGEPYICHLARVSLTVADAGGSLEAQVAALLHDSIEDGCITAIELRRRGAPDRIVQLVELLTIREEDDYFDDYLARVASDPEASAVKAADIADNANEERLALLNVYQAKRLRAKYAKAARTLLELIEHNTQEAA